MKAMTQDRYGSAEVLRLAEVDPPTIRDDQVLVRVRAAGVHPGDWHLMTGTPYLVRAVSGLRKPKTRVPGMDVAGQVEAVGKDVTRFRPGDEVFGSGEGGFAEYARARESRLAPKPAGITFEQAAVVPTSGVTALQGLRDKAGVRSGQRVLVIGAGGGVGTFAVQIATSYGAEVTGVCSTGKVDLVRSIGAAHVIDYTREDFTQRDDRYDVILDTAGNRPLSQLRRALSPGGTLVLVGGEGGGGRWFGGALSASLRASLMSLFVRQRLRMFLAMTRAKDLLALKELIEAGKVTPVIDRSYPLDRTPDAIHYLAQWHARGKVVISIG
jgi:NADPH:quinone reductase-like Zn-dependent oxidoreductase